MLTTPPLSWAVAYGDQWTNMVQPFWTLPLLAIVRLSIRDIFPYLFRIAVVSGVIMSVGIFLVSNLSL